MQLEYLQPEQLQLQPGDVPKKGRWPHIRAPIWPFNAHLVSPAVAYGCQLSHQGDLYLAKDVFALHMQCYQEAICSNNQSRTAQLQMKECTSLRWVRDMNALASACSNL